MIVPIKNATTLKMPHYDPVAKKRTVSMKHGAGLISYTEMAEVSDKLYTSKGSKVKEYELRVCSGLTKGGQLNGMSNSGCKVSALVMESPVSNRCRACGNIFLTFLF